MNLLFKEGMTITQKLILLKLFAGGGGGGSILKTVTGALLHITDALAKPVHKFTATLEPIQDLHGQDAPYPAGGGKNLSTAVSSGSSTDDGVKFNYSGNTISVSGTATASNSEANISIVPVVLKANTTHAFGVGQRGIIKNIRIAGVAYAPNSSGYFTLTFTEDTTISDFNIRLSSVSGDTVNASWNWQLEAGSTASAWSPYENICPITGYTGVEVYHSGADTSNPTTIPITFPVLGKNLLDMSDANIEVGKYIDNSGTEKTNGSNFYNSVYIPVKASTAYTLGTSSGIKYCSFMEYDENKTFIKRTLYGNGSTPFTTQSHTMGDTTAFVLVGSNPTGSTIDLAAIKAINWMFNEGSTAEAYEPYTSTVYGGTLDVTSGLLEVYPYYDSYNGETLTGHWISNMDKYEVGTTPTIGAQVVNDGATPITHQITPTEITLLQGENNIWTDTNSDLELKYYATSE